MLACVRIGAIHSVVFAGFGAGALADRIAASGSRAVFTTRHHLPQGQRRRARCRSSRDAVAQSSVQAAGLSSASWSCVARRRSCSGSSSTGRTSSPAARPVERPRGDGGERARPTSSPPRARPRSRSSPSTSTAATRSTSRHGALGASGCGREDVCWATRGHRLGRRPRYIVYAPLLIGCTTVAYEGALDYPAQDAAWARDGAPRGDRRLHLAHRGPAADALRRGGRPSARPLLRSSGSCCAGEVLNPPAWEWLQKTVFEDRIPVIDNMWQTETGGPIFGNPYGIEMMPIKPGSAGVPLPGIEAAIVTMDGTELGPNEKGIMVIRRPFPGLTPTLWGEPERYEADYWGRIPGVVLGGRRGAHRRGRLRVVRGPRRRDHQDRGPSARHDRGGERPSCATRPWPRRASPVGPTSCAAR